MSDSEAESCTPQAPTSASAALKTRCWGATIHGADLSEDSFPWLDSKMTHAVWQIETGGATNRTHIQAAFRLKNPTTMEGTKKLLKLPQVHLTPLRTQADYHRMVKYCQKEDTRTQGPWEQGELTKQGQRSDLGSLATKIIEGKRPRDVAHSDPALFIRYHKGLQALRGAMVEPRQRFDKLKVLCLWGESGSGKTRFAYDLFDAKDIYKTFNLTHPWFDGYDDQKIVIMDECGEGMMDINFLKQLTDGHPMMVEVKGGSVAWNPETIILTSQHGMYQWYPKATRLDWAALERRIQSFRLPDDVEDARTYVLTGSRPRVGGTWGDTTQTALHPEPTLVDVIDIDSE